VLVATAPGLWFRPRQAFGADESASSAQVDGFRVHRSAAYAYDLPAGSNGGGTGFVGVVVGRSDAIVRVGGFGDPLTPPPSARRASAPAVQQTRSAAVRKRAGVGHLDTRHTRRVRAQGIELRRPTCTLGPLAYRPGEKQTHPRNRCAGPRQGWLVLTFHQGSERWLARPEPHRPVAVRRVARGNRSEALTRSWRSSRGGTGKGFALAGAGPGPADLLVVGNGKGNKHLGRPPVGPNTSGRHRVGDLILITTRPLDNRQPGAVRRPHHGVGVLQPPKPGPGRPAHRVQGTWPPSSAKRLR